ncbi:transcription initiation factor tfiid subunit 7 [Acrodontium crateriforme]|uniref:Transcription initiation factor tfiid subunit 7 n=1 Tax=Acrodontium crateriforme TaxID=150365 RepID=A0AAQ3R2E0_9PEZI|nr:transcription initiation factor tfiid subunit 7 [Acrodontium crateriforme]
MKLKLSVNGNKSLSHPTPSPSAASPPPPPTPAASSGLIKLKVSQPPTPLTPSTDRPITKKTTKKRPAEDDYAPAAKRPNLPSRKISLKINPQASHGATSAPNSAGGLNKIPLKRRQNAPKLTGLLNNKGRPIPKRKPGEGYDSEDSDVEQDPAQQQGFILRMEPGSDADYLRDAIANGKIGLSRDEGGADVALKFITPDLRRAVVRIRNRLYAAALVDLPCIVESMKSWDRKGWWKVADVCQMLLVLGSCKNEEDAKTYPLPREVDEKLMQYAHGLTPPMHWVRKRRFRKRQSHRTLANIEEEVQRLLDEDEAVERGGGKIEVEEQDFYQLDREEQSSEEDAEGDAISTVENDDYDDDDEDADGDLAADLEADLEAAFQGDGDDTIFNELVSDSPAPMSDPANSFVAGDAGILDYPIVETPIVQTPLAQTPRAETPMADPQTSDAAEESNEDDDDEDDDSSADDFDEDAAARAAEKEQQKEEIADLVREIANARAKVAAMTNQLLRNREMGKLQKLEEDLRNKRAGFGMEEEDDDDDDENEAN